MRWYLCAASLSELSFSYFGVESELESKGIRQKKKIY